MIKLVHCNIIQTIQYNNHGAPLYRFPYNVTSLPTGEVFVVDRGSVSKRVVCVDRDGQHLFTWTGELKEFQRQYDKFDPLCITHNNGNVFVTNNNFSRVYVIRCDGTGAKCLYIMTQPLGIAVNNNGQLLVGGSDGRINTIEY